MTIDDVITALRGGPEHSVEEARSLASAEPGLYSWWADPRSLPPEVPRVPHPETRRALI